MAKGLRGGKYSGQVAPVIEEPKVAETQQPKTKYNEQGFEVEDSDSPDINFTDSWWDAMKELKRRGNFEDADLADRVDHLINDLVTEYGDLERYDADLTILVERMEDAEHITSDEYWAGIHSQAKMLGMKSRLDTLLDNKKVNEAVQRAFHKANGMKEPDIYKAIYSYKPLQGLSDKDIDAIYDYLSERLFGRNR